MKKLLSAIGLLLTASMLSSCMLFFPWGSRLDTADEDLDWLDQLFDELEEFGIDWDEDYDLIYDTEEYTVNSLQLRYPDWVNAEIIPQGSAQTLVLEGTSSVVRVVSTIDGGAFDSMSYLNNLLQTDRQMYGDTYDLEISDPEEIVLNGEVWAHCSIELSDSWDTSYLERYVFVDNEYAYSIIVSHNPDIDDELVDTVLDTAAINSFFQPDLEAEFLKAFAGEWEGGAGGFLIIHDNKEIEWFQDTSQSPDNVLFGFLSVEDRMVPLEAGYANVEYSVQIQFTQNTVDGVDEDTDYRMEYTFVSHADGSITVYNLTSNSRFDMNRADQNSGTI